MSKRALLLLLVLGLAGCADSPNPTTTRRANPANFTTREIEGCEYIEYDYGVSDQRVYSITHKGNCKNSIHKSGESNGISK